MNYSHGCLENEILKTIWKLEDEREEDVSVNDVQTNLNAMSESERAYTTVKTVMDRLVEKICLFVTNRAKSSSIKQSIPEAKWLTKLLKNLQDSILTMIL